MDIFDKILELSQMGYECGQILMLLMLEGLEEENEGLVKAMAGLSGGCGYSGGCCGCMPAACCLLSYFTGKGDPDSADHPRHKEALKEFTDWFTDEMLMEHQSTDCRDIILGNPANRVQYCPQIIAASYEKCMEILQERGIL